MILLTNSKNNKTCTMVIGIMMPVVLKVLTVSIITMVLITAMKIIKSNIEIDR